MSRHIRQTSLTGAPPTALVLAALVLAGCGGQGAALPEPGTGPTAGGAVSFQKILTAFDAADSSASGGGDLDRLGTLETSPSLEVSVAAVHRARATGRSQPVFRHLKPDFAGPDSDDPRCFLVTANLQLTGEEMSPTDVSHFVRDREGRWLLSHNVQVTPDAAGAARGIAGHAAQPGGLLLEESRRSALAAELFSRTIAAGAPDHAVVAPNRLLDQQLAAGWNVYREQMSGAGMTVTRTLTGSEWSTCAVSTTGGVLTFLTLYAVDTVGSKLAGTPVTLPPNSPDVMSSGRRGPVSGSAVKVSRLEVFLLLVPASGAAGVLGLVDAATAVEPER